MEPPPLAPSPLDLARADLTLLKTQSVAERRALAADACRDIDPWTSAMHVVVGCSEAFTIRALCRDDAALMVAFARTGLSAKSRELFAPFDWMGTDEALAMEFGASIINSTTRTDLHLIALVGGGDAAGSAAVVVAHAFLWSVAGAIPELGIAVADEWHGRGLGSSLLLVLEAHAREMNKAALELTTMTSNETAFNAYVAAGYELLGMIRNPVGVDVTAAFRGDVVATRFCDERQMVLVLDEARREETLTALAEKRVEAAEMFGGS